MFDPTRAGVGDTVSASITVRGASVTEQSGLSLAAPALAAWEEQIKRQLPLGLDTTSSDAFAPKPQGEYAATRTLTVVAKQETA